MNKRGTSLFEVLLYLSISMLVLTGTARIVLGLHHSIWSTVQRHDELLELSTALIQWAHDMRRVQPKGVVNLSKSSCIVRLKDCHCGWIHKKERLLRYMGTYMPLTGRWKNVSASVAVFCLKDVAYMPVYLKERLVGIECTLKSEYHTLTLFSAMEAL